MLYERRRQKSTFRLGDASHLLLAGRKRPASQLVDRHRSEALLEDHRDVLRGERWKLQRVRSLSALPTDADLLASLKQGEPLREARQCLLITYSRSMSKSFHHSKEQVLQWSHEKVRSGNVCLQTSGTLMAK